MNKIRGNKPEIQEDIFNSWQRIVDMMAKISDVPAVLIMKAEPLFWKSLSPVRVRITLIIQEIKRK